MEEKNLKLVINNNSIDFSEMSWNKYVRYNERELDDLFLKYQVVDNIVYHNNDFTEFGEFKNCYLIYPSDTNAAGLFFYDEKIIYKNIC